MLNGNFFNFTEPQTGDGSVQAMLTLNAQHQIFNGHFPGQPVVPGVCMVQMVKEVLENVTTEKLRLISAADIKFLAVLNPFENSTVDLKITLTPAADNVLKVDAAIQHQELVFLKFKGQFKPADIISGQ